MSDQKHFGRASKGSAVFAFLGRCATILSVMVWLVMPLAALTAPAHAHPIQTSSHGHTHHQSAMATGQDDCSGRGHSEGAACIQMCLSHCTLAIISPVLVQSQGMRGQVIVFAFEAGHSVSREPIVPPPRLLS